MTSDERLDLLVERVIRLEEQVKSNREESRDCLQSVKDLRHDLDQRALSRERERKEDRRWMVGTIFAAAGLIVTATAIIVPLVA